MPVPKSWLTYFSYLTVPVCTVVRQICNLIQKRYIKSSRITIVSEADKYWEKWTPREGFILPEGNNISLSLIGISTIINEL